MLIEARARQFAFYALLLAAASLSFSISFFEIFVYSFFALSFVYLWNDTAKKREIFKNPFVWLLGIYFLFNLLSLTQTEYLSNSLRGMGKVAKGILLCVFAYAVSDSEEKHSKIFETLLWMALAVNLDAVAQGFTGHELLGRNMTKFSEEVGRVTGTFIHANDFSAYLCVTFFLFLGAVLSGKYKTSSWKFYVWGAGAVLSFVCLLWTYSRGAWLAVFISFILSLFFRRNKWLIFLVASLIALGLIFAPPSLKQRFQSVTNIFQSGTAVERRILWNESLKMIEKSPWLGLGVNTYSKNEPFYKAPTAGPRHQIDNQYAHNGYLQIGAELGLLGLASFLLILLYFMVRIFPKLASNAQNFAGGAGFGYAFGLFAFFIHSGMDTNLQSLRLVNFFWLLLGLSFSLYERRS